MRSLRLRLTVSFAIVVALVLALVSLLACRVAFGLLARPAMDALSVAESRATVAAAAGGSGTPAARALAAARAVPDVVAFVRGGPGRDGSRDGRSRGSARRAAIDAQAPPDSRPPPDGIAGSGPPPDGAFGDRPPGSLGRATGPPQGFGRTNLLVHVVVLPLLGAEPRDVLVGRSRLVIEPTWDAIDGPFRETGILLVGELVASAALAWTFAAWLTGQAIRPLALVTSELRRFASGDLRPRPIETTDRAELGDLIAAYNGAAAQVASALGERAAVEANLRRFLADAGHELRTPLTVVGGYLQILRDGGSTDPATLGVALATLDDQTRRMRALVERLLSLARLERSEQSETAVFDPFDGTRDAIATVVSARGGDVALVGESGTRVIADPIEFAEAVGNLVDNAVKYGDASPVRVALASDADEVVVRVTDGGPGIPPSERERIFERFYRGESHGEIDGSGLGLAIVARAIGRCGGSVVLERAEPGSTTFALHLPRLSAAIESSADGASRRPLRV